MIKIQIGNLNAQIQQIDTRMEQIAITKALTFLHPDRYWMSRYRQHQWDGKISFLNKYNMSFPTGLVDILPSSVREKLVIVDSRKIPCDIPNIVPELNGIILRDYQE